MEQQQGVLVSPIAGVPVVEGEMVRAIRELTSRGWGAEARNDRGHRHHGLSAGRGP